MKYVFWISVGIFILWLIKITDIFNLILLFMIAGAIPGTNILLPPIAMMIFLSLMLLVVAYWIKKRQLVTQIKDLKNTPSKSNTKKRAPTTKKTASQKRARRSRPKA
ncbi:MAG: hypothetical protein PVI21_01230 [Candidatus Woesebacteria bacterium]|jgi:membrane protein implicated in regulation of membrane protease activity